jgi:hypothetical protein
MQRHQCPVCETPISLWTANRMKSFRLQRREPGFPCPGCGVTLEWTLGRWNWIQTVVGIAGCVAIPILFAAKLPDNQFLMAMMSLCVGMTVVMLIVRLLAAHLVVLDDDPGTIND